MSLPEITLPTTEDEHWRYSRIAELDLAAYEPAPTPEGGMVGLPPIARSGFALVVDGRLVASEVADDAAARGVTIESGGQPAGVRGPRTDGVDALHDHLVAEVVTITIPRGVTVAHPIVVLHDVNAPGAASAPHLVVRAGEDSDVTIYDSIGSADDRVALVLPQVELDVADAARVRYVNVQRLGERVWQLGRQSSRVGRDATFSTTMVALGGDYSRLAVESTMVGKGSTGAMRALYFGGGNQMHDFRTLQDHTAPHTSSNLLFKGAVAGHARAVYTGLIHIAKEANGVDAQQTNRNVKLSEHAWAESVPNLEIENNDVRCSHASAVGPVDEEQRFYLESRGVPPDVADQLIVLGFLDEVLEDLPVADALPELRQELVAKLARSES